MGEMENGKWKRREMMQCFVLLDRSGSMMRGWDETLGALNAYARKLRAKDRLTLCSFDNEGVDDLRVKVRPGDWRDVAEDEVSPRGMTPLYDAIGEMARRVDVGKGKKASIVMMTDGQENASRELSRDDARLVIEGWKGRGFDVVFIGADFDAFGEARGLGLGAGQTINVSKARMRGTWDAMATRTRAYGVSGQVVDFTDEEREELK